MSINLSTYGMLTEHFIERLGLDWRRRARLLDSDAADLSMLYERDQRMLAAVDGLHHLGEPGLQGTQARLSEALDERSLFALVVQACAVRERQRFEACAAMAETMPHLREAFICALDWVTPDDLLAVWHPAARDTTLQRLIHARLLSCAHFDSVTRRPARAQSAPELRLLLKAARLRAQPAWVQIDDEEVAKLDTPTLTAYCQLRLVFGGEALGHTLLEQHFERTLAPGADGDALRAVFAAEPGPVGERFIRALYERTGADRRLLQALGWRGSARSVPDLARLLDDTSHARRAAQTLTMITGAVPARDGWSAAAPPPAPVPDAQLPPSDPDRDLPWPSRSGFLSWWETHRSRFNSDQPYLLGLPRTRRNLLSHLGHGALRWRPAAAWLLQRQAPACALDTALPAPMQYTTLARLERDLEPTP